MRLSKKSQPELSPAGPPSESLGDQVRRRYLEMLGGPAIAELTQPILAVLFGVGKSVADFERDQRAAKTRFEAQKRQRQADAMQGDIIKAGQGVTKAEEEHNQICGECEQKMMDSRRAEDAAVERHNSLLHQQAALEQGARTVLLQTADPGIAKRIKVLTDRRNGLIERAMRTYRCQGDPRVMAEIQPVNDEIHRLEALRLDALGGLFANGIEQDKTAGVMRSGAEYPRQFETAEDMVQV